MSLVRNGISAKPEGDSRTPIFSESALFARCVSTWPTSDLSITKSATLAQTCLQRGDIVFTCYNGSRQYVALCARNIAHDGKRLFPDKLFSTRVSSKLLLTSFLAENSLTCMAFGAFKSSLKIRTTARHSVSGEDIKNIPVPVCCFDEQRNRRRTRIQTLRSRPTRPNPRHRAATGRRAAPVHPEKGFPRSTGKTGQKRRTRHRPARTHPRREINRHEVRQAEENRAKILVFYTVILPRRIMPIHVDKYRSYK